jgi:DNA polymerase III alpha subunit
MQSKLQTELQGRVLFYDGTTAWAKANLLNKILEDGIEGVLTYEKVDGVPQKTLCGPLPESEWLIPDEYQNRGVYADVLAKASAISQLAVDRVHMELELFEERDMIHWLRVLLYIKETMEAEGIVWGVGRGSSVSSYVLYLMGIHSVDSLKFNLDIREFLR